jgi:hypothetical protein
MEHSCEVCDNFKPRSEFGAQYRVVEVAFDVRPVHLCIGHARIAENSGARSFDELRDLYGSGRRSFVPRRTPGSVVGNGKMRNAGRRVTDE